MYHESDHASIEDLILDKDDEPHQHQAGLRPDHLSAFMPK